MAARRDAHGARRLDNSRLDNSRLDNSRLDNSRGWASRVLVNPRVTCLLGSVG
jgi:hypothetical protein